LTYDCDMCLLESVFVNVCYDTRCLCAYVEQPTFDKSCVFLIEKDNLIQLI